VDVEDLDVGCGLSVLDSAQDACEGDEHVKGADVAAFVGAEVGEVVEAEDDDAAAEVRVEGAVALVFGGAGACEVEMGVELDDEEGFARVGELHPEVGVAEGAAGAEAGELGLALKELGGDLLGVLEEPLFDEEEVGAVGVRGVREAAVLGVGEAAGAAGADAEVLEVGGREGLEVRAGGLARRGGGVLGGLERGEDVFVAEREADVDDVEARGGGTICCGPLWGPCGRLAVLEGVEGGGEEAAEGAEALGERGAAAEGVEAHDEEAGRGGRGAAGEERGVAVAPGAGGVLGGVELDEDETVAGGHPDVDGALDAAGARGGEAGAGAPEGRPEDGEVCARALGEGAEAEGAALGVLRGVVRGGVRGAHGAAGGELAGFGFWIFFWIFFVDFLWIFLDFFWIFFGFFCGFFLDFFGFFFGFWDFLGI